MENETYGERVAIKKYDGHIEGAAVKALKDYQSGTVLYAGYDVEMAKDYCRQNDLTQEHVKIVRRNGTDDVLVVRR